MEIKEIGSLSLAFVGDAHYGLLVREYLVRHTHARPQELQRLSTHYVSAKAQAKIVSHLLEEDWLNAEEIEIYKRGRNAKSHTVPKNTDVQTYHMSTGFEALWGYWYLSGQEARLTQIWNEVRTFIGG